MIRHVEQQLLALLLVSAVASNSSARTWHVRPDGTGDAPTIQAAVDSAFAGDQILLASGTYTWTAQSPRGESMVVMKPNLRLIGEFGPESTILDGETLGRLIRCHDVGDVFIDGITITRGNLRTHPSPDGFGGGIYSTGDSRVTVNNCFIINNAVHHGNRGGGIACIDGGSTITNSTISENFGAYDSAGGGVYMIGGLITACRILRNTSSGDGGMAGGILMIDGTIEDCWIEGNRARGFSGATGGGVRKSRGAILRSTFVDNEAVATGYGGGEGGGIYCSDPLLIKDCVFIGNSALGAGFPGVGGAIAGGATAVVSIHHCTLLGNKADSEGEIVEVGGISLPAGGDVISSILARNEGLACRGPVNISCSDFYDNLRGESCRRDSEGNFDLDPIFCVPDPYARRDVSIAVQSPCAAGRHPLGLACGTIGAGSVACNRVGIQVRSWGAVKTTFKR